MPPPEPSSRIKTVPGLGIPARAGREKKALATPAPMSPVAFAIWRSLELRRLGRTLYHAGVLGVLAGLAAVAFYALTDAITQGVYERFAGLVSPKTAGQLFVTTGFFHRRWWLIVLIPALGGLACGAITTFLAPEVAAGGGNAYLEAFHRGRGLIRRRVLALKVLASSITLGTGGSGGREGPTMQIGAAAGSFLGRMLKVDDRERRILLCAGAAGGMGAIFRTPLGGAIFAVEVLYRDDIEGDALVPAVIASVTAYSVLITILGRGHEFALPSHHGGSAIVPPQALPLFIVLGVVLALGGIGFARTLAAAHHFFDKLEKVPRWTRPAIGGLLVGLLSLLFPQVSGIGYGWLEAAVNGDGWADPHRYGTPWATVGLLFGVALLKIAATSFTIGSGGAGGDFGPAVFIGGILGCAVGGFFHVLMPHYAPPAWTFGLVGMGAMFGGIAHVPIASLIMVCEMAGSYDLVVPLMLAEGVTFVLCRRDTLYSKQVRTRAESPAHRDELTIDLLEDLHVRDVVAQGEDIEAWVVRAGTPLRDLVDKLTGASSAGPLAHLVVVDSGRRPRGVVDLDSVREVLFDKEVAEVAVAADVMRPVTPLGLDVDLHHALGHMIEAGVSAAPIVDGEGKLVGVLSQELVSRAYHAEVVRREVDSPASLREG